MFISNTLAVLSPLLISEFLLVIGKGPLCELSVSDELELSLV